MINDRGAYARPFAHLGLEVTHNIYELVKNPQDIALVVFTGGEDVSPELYGEKPHVRSMYNPARDEVEVAAFKTAHSEGIPMAGICRGSQFLCVMAGGKLVQDITSHAGPNHLISYRLRDGEEGQVEVTSSHHQMQHPFNLPEEDYEIIAWTPEPRSWQYAFNPVDVIPVAEADARTKLEPDIVYYPKIKALAAQFHPEWMSEDSDAVVLYRRLLAEYLGLEAKEGAQKRSA